MRLIVAIVVLNIGMLIANPEISDHVQSSYDDKFYGQLENTNTEDTKRYGRTMGRVYLLEAVTFGFLYVYAISRWYRKSGQ